jgi:diguanylate cyclase (GGDEF)-like protein
MASPGDPNPSRLSAENAFLELLADTLATLERPARGQFLQRFFRAVAHLDLSEGQSLEVWEQILTWRRELSEGRAKKISLQAALVDVLASLNLMRLPIVIEYEDLRKLQINAATDSLTGLYNRRFFDDYFSRELNRSIRYSHRLALVVFVLHRFKEVNDRYGHMRGDVLLQLAATTLRKSLRTSDYAFRIGGDEFALLLPQSETEQASALSRRLRAAYAATIEPMRLGIPLALDYGLAVYPNDGETPGNLLRVADERLYRLKFAERAPNQPASGAASGEENTGAVEQKQVASASAATAGETEVPDIQPQRLERRRWERVPLSGTRAYALIGQGVERTARVMDLGYGGVALESATPEEYGEVFHAVLHVPILPPVRVRLRCIYQTQLSGGGIRMGCAFVT